MPSGHGTVHTLCQVSDFTKYRRGPVRSLVALCIVNTSISIENGFADSGSEQISNRRRVWPKIWEGGNLVYMTWHDRFQAGGK